MDVASTTPSFLLDPTIWVLASFILFVVAAYVFGRKAALGTLDDKIEKIRKEIELSSQLKIEAQALLDQYKKDAASASQNAQDIIRQAQLQAAEIIKKGEQDVAESMARRESMMVSRISQMEHNAIDDIKRYAADLAISATTEIIAQSMTPQKTSELASQSIQNLREQIN